MRRAHRDILSKFGRRTMAKPRVSIRIDLETGERIGPAKIALLEAIKAQGSISGAARLLGMSYRGAWLRVNAINQALSEPAVTANPGGRNGGGAAVTQVGTQLVEPYHAVEAHVQAAASGEIQAICGSRGLARHPPEGGTAPVEEGARSCCRDVTQCGRDHCSSEARLTRAGVLGRIYRVFSGGGIK
jgi:molybdate transport system regulatory protein